MLVCFVWLLCGKCECEELGISHTCPKQCFTHLLLHLIVALLHRIPFPLHGGVLLLQFAALVVCCVQLLAKRVSLLLKIVVQSGSCAHTHVVFQEEGKSEREDKTMVWKCKC